MASRSLQRRSWARPGLELSLGASRGCLGSLGRSFGVLGAILKPLGASWEPAGGLGGSSWGGWLFVWPSWVVLGAFEAVLGLSCEPLGPSWGDLGGLVGRLGRREDTTDEYA